MKHTLYVTLLALTLGVVATASPAEASPGTNLCAYLKAGELIGVINWLGLLDCETVTARTPRVPPPELRRPPCLGCTRTQSVPAPEKRHPPCLACNGFPRVESDRARDDDGQPVEPRGEPKFELRPKVWRSGGS